MVTSNHRAGVVLLCAVVVGVLVSAAGVAAASVEPAALPHGTDFLSVETQYPHPSEDSQAVAVTVTFEPEGNPVTDLTVTLVETRRGFIDFGSSSTEKTSAAVTITEPRQGWFRIEGELAAGERITITFNAYPRTISREQLTVAQVASSFTHNGHTVEESEGATADLSSSYYFRYKRVADPGPVGTFGPPLLAGLVGGGLIFALMYVRLRRDRSYVLSELRSLKTRLDTSSGKNRVQRVIDDLEDRWGDGGGGESEGKIRID